MALEPVNSNLSTEERAAITQQREGTIYSEAQWIRLAVQERLMRDIRVEKVVTPRFKRA